MSCPDRLTDSRLEAAYQTALAALLKERTPEGHWVGELSTSALSTATAIMALWLIGKHGGDAHPDLIANGLRWLSENQNDDGGWGDTIRSLSNISTTMLCRSAFYLTGSGQRKEVSQAECWLEKGYGCAANWPEAIRVRYGKDRTFATPILTTCALAGLVSWDEVPPLPFEFACLPQAWFRFVRLHVVSYALPALIAIGQAIFVHHPPRNPLTRWLRSISRARSLRVLQAIQPSSGGFLEATPLTSFVTMSLASIDLARHPVAKSGVEFLVRSVRPDGSWAIDSNLATWVTTLAINALATAKELQNLDRLDHIKTWLLDQQYHDRHPYTGAPPGGWAWTDLPGGVPDADDTPGAILALEALGEVKHPALDKARTWLYGLQNSDGGMPTFCRGWGHLPFDRSGSDLTAHALRAWKMLTRSASEGRSDPSLALRSGIAYLEKHQHPDGYWLPLWFGNQHAPNDENPTYGTARVLAAYRDLDKISDESAQRGIAWLTRNQNPDGGWGAGLGTSSSIEESALAVEILLDVGPMLQETTRRGLTYLIEQIEQGGLEKPTPIGFYFAKLWYFERLYPIIFSIAALGRARHPQHPVSRQDSPLGRIE